MNTNKTLRLLLWETCNSKCKGCCNKDWDLKTLPTITFAEMNQYDLIMLTGGEPMLYPNTLLTIIHNIKKYAPRAHIIMYTAKVDNHDAMRKVMRELDGVTVTLHTPKDAKTFKDFYWSMEPQLYDEDLRLNIFKGVRNPLPEDDPIWIVKQGIQWIKNCPLPAGEDFKRLA